MIRFMIGLFCGVTLGMVAAPASGEETRRRLRWRAERWREASITKGREAAREVGSAVAEKLYDRAVGEKGT
jgi:gas vesicle protein